jgi:hypothetical protein
MAWNDDSWRDGYDDWKLASPDDEYDEPCEHDYWETDILTGIATCERCGERRMLSNEELQAQAEHEAAYNRMVDEWERRQWWRDLWDRIKAPFRLRRKPVNDDDIPF